jgi:MFS family permease
MTPLAAAPPSARASGWGLGVLILLGLYTYMDRQIIGLQAEPIRQQLALGDAQLGLIQGAGVALVTALAGYPIGWLADRCDRRRVLAGCLAVWCIAVALCGAATSFWALLLASALVGAAEAGLLPIAYAAIPEWFQGRRRPVANSAFVFLGRLSAGLVIVACGWLIHEVDQWRPFLPELLQDVPAWRLALGAAALPGLLLLPLIFTLPSMHARAAAHMPVRVGAVLRSHPVAFAAILGGAGLLGLGANAFGSFVPVAAARAWDVPPLQAGRGLGAAALAGAASALVITALLTRRSGLTHRHGTAMGLASVALACAAATALGAPLAPSPGMFFGLYGLNLAGVMTAVMLLPTALQPLCPAPVRVRLMSLFVGTTIVVGSAGPVVVGALSDGLGGSAHGLITAMASVALVSHAMAALLLAWGARWCARDLPADDGAPVARRSHAAGHVTHP